MAEPLSFVASCIAVAQLAGTVCVKGHKYLHSVKNCVEEVKQLQIELNVLCGVLGQLRVHAESEYRLQNGESASSSTYPGANSSVSHQVEGYLSMPDARDDDGVLLQRPAAIFECQRTLLEIECILDKFGSTESAELNTAKSDDAARPKTTHRLALLGKKGWRWPLARSETKQLIERLERHKSTCSLAFQEYSLTSIHAILDTVAFSNKHIAMLMEQQKQILDSDTSEFQRKALSWLSSVNPADKFRIFKQERQKDTGFWFFDLPKTEHWLETPKSAYWIWGIPGAGKTILSTLVVDWMQKQRLNAKGAAYFYVRHDDPESHLPLNVFGSLLAQLARQHPEALRIVMDLYQDHVVSATLPQHPDVHQLVEALQQASTYFSDTFILVDGLDECGSSFDPTRETLIRLLSELHKPMDCSIRTIVFSRDVPDIRRSFEPHFDIVSIAAVNSDLRLYIDAWIDTLRIQSDTIRNEVVDGLLDGAQGMFMWVRAQIDFLRRLPNDTEKQKALKELPPDIPSTYIRIFERIDQDYPPISKDMIRRTLVWLLQIDKFAPTISIILQALQFEFADDWFSAPAIATKDVLLDWFGCMVRCVPIRDYDGVGHEDLEDELILSHYSIKEFLLSNPTRLRSEIAATYLVCPHSLIQGANICLNFVNQPVFGAHDDITQEFENDFPFYYAAAYTLAVILQPDSPEGFDKLNQDMLMDFLGAPTTRPFLIWTKYLYWAGFGEDYAYGYHPYTSPMQMAFKMESIELVEQLLCAKASASPDVEPFLIQYCMGRWSIDEGFGDVMVLRIRDDIYDKGEYENKTNVFSDIKLISKLLDHGATNEGIQGSAQRNIRIELNGVKNGTNLVKIFCTTFRGTTLCVLCSAILTLEKSIVRLMKDRGSRDHFSESDSGATSCIARKIFLRLLRDVEDLRHYRVFREMCDSDSVMFVESVADILRLERAREPKPKPLDDITIDTDSTDEITMGTESIDDTTMGTENTVQSLFLDACADDRWHDAKRLLSTTIGIQIDLSNAVGYTPICFASANRNEVLRFCLEKGANPNPAPHSPTPLCKAAEAGLCRNLTTLLRCGARTDCVDHKGLTALHYAAVGDWPDAMMILLKAGASPYACSKEKQNVIHTIAQAGGISGLRLLMDQSIDFDRPMDNGSTPIAYSVETSDIRALETLVHAGANVDLRTENLRPLELAALYANIECVKILLEAGAKVDAVDDCGRQVIHFASLSKHPNAARVVQLLLEHGVDVRSTTYDVPPLHCAVRCGTTGTVRSLLSAGHNVDVVAHDGSSVLDAALLSGSCLSLKKLQLLLQHGANPNIRSKVGGTPLSYAAGLPIPNSSYFYWLLSLDPECGTSDFRGYGPLHYASKAGFPDRVATLLEMTPSMLGVLNPDRNSAITTPLYIAADHGYERVIELLLASGADINGISQGCELGPPVMVAARKGNYSTVKLLVAHDAELSHPGAKYHSVHKTAYRYRQTKLLELMGPEESYEVELGEEDTVIDPDEDDSVMDLDDDSMMDLDEDDSMMDLDH